MSPTNLSLPCQSQKDLERTQTYYLHDGTQHIPSSRTLLTLVACVIFCVRILRRRRACRLRQENANVKTMQPGMAALGTSPGPEPPLQTTSSISQLHECQSVRTRFDLSPMCLEEPFDVLQPRPPEPTIRRLSNTSEPDDQDLAMKFIKHTTFVQRMSGLENHSDTCIYGDIWRSENQNRRSGWRRKQWVVMPS